MRRSVIAADTVRPGSRRPPPGEVGHHSPASQPGPSSVGGWASHRHHGRRRGVAKWNPTTSASSTPITARAVTGLGPSLSRREDPPRPSIPRCERMVCSADHRRKHRSTRCLPTERTSSTRHPDRSTVARRGNNGSRCDAASFPRVSGAGEQRGAKRSRPQASAANRAATISARVSAVRVQNACASSLPRVSPRIVVDATRRSNTSSPTVEGACAAWSGYRRR